MAGRRKTYTSAEPFAIITSDSGATVVPLESSSDDSDLLLPELDTDNSDSEVRIPSPKRYVISIIDYLLIWCQIDDLFTLLHIIYLSITLLTLLIPNTHYWYSLPYIYIYDIICINYHYQYFVHSLFDTISILSSLYSFLHCWEDLANQALLCKW